MILRRTKATLTITIAKLANSIAAPKANWAFGHTLSL